MSEFRGTPAEFLTQAREYAERKYALGELADEHDEKIARAIEADETPEYWIERLAEKYDLDPIDKVW